MTSAEMARIHAAAMRHERPWQAAEFDALRANPHTHVTQDAHGFALWRAIAGEAELLTIAVDPKAQGQGVGTALMSAWMHAAGRVAQEAFLEVAADNAPARALYARSGFDTVSVRPGYYARAQGKVDALVMRRPLT